MPDVLRTVGPLAPSTLPVPDERAARRTLLDQVARLEQPGQLVEAVVLDRPGGPVGEHWRLWAGDGDIC